MGSGNLATFSWHFTSYKILNNYQSCIRKSVFNIHRWVEEPSDHHGYSDTSSSFQHVHVPPPSTSWRTCGTPSVRHHRVQSTRPVSRRTVNNRHSVNSHMLSSRGLHWVRGDMHPIPMEASTKVSGDLQSGEQKWQAHCRDKASHEHVVLPVTSMDAMKSAELYVFSGLWGVHSQTHCALHRIINNWDNLRNMSKLASYYGYQSTRHRVVTRSTRHTRVITQSTRHKRAHNKTTSTSLHAIRRHPETVLNMDGIITAICVTLMYTADYRSRRQITLPEKHGQLVTMPWNLTANSSPYFTVTSWLVPVTTCWANIWLDWLFLRVVGSTGWFRGTAKNVGLWPAKFPSPVLDL